MKRPIIGYRPDRKGKPEVPSEALTVRRARDARLKVEEELPPDYVSRVAQLLATEHQTLQALKSRKGWRQHPTR